MNRVACGILLKNNKILMSKRDKKKREFPNYWEFPGGKCNKNESIKNCVTREVKEELNIDIEFIKTVFKKKYNNTNINYCICNIIDDKNIKKNKEISEYRYININDINRLKLIKGDDKIIHYIKPFMN